MADSELVKAESGTNSKTQWDDTDKEDVLKQMKKQLLLLKKVKMKCDDLTKSNVNLETDLRQKNEECTNLKDRIAELESENNIVKQSSIKLESDNLNCNTRIRSLEEQLECVIMKEETANATFICLQEEIKTLQDKNKILIEEMSILNSARDEALVLMKSWEHEIKASHEKDVKDLVENIESATNSRIELQTMNEDLKCDNERISNLLIDVQRENSELFARIVSLENDVKQGETRLTEVNKNFERSLIECQNLTTESCDLKAKVDEYYNRYKDVEFLVDIIYKNSGILDDFDDVASKLNACVEMITSKFNTISTQDDGLNIIYNRVEQLETVHNHINGQLEKSTNYLENLETKIIAMEHRANVPRNSVLSQTDCSFDDSSKSGLEALISNNQHVEIVEKIDQSVQVELSVGDDVDAFAQTEEMDKIEQSVQVELNVSGVGDDVDAFAQTIEAEKIEQAVQVELNVGGVRDDVDSFAQTEEMDKIEQSVQVELNVGGFGDDVDAFAQTTEVEKIEQAVQVELNVGGIRNDVDSFAQTEEVVQVDVYTSIDVDDFASSQQDNLDVINTSRIMEDNSTQTDAISNDAAESVEKVDKSLNLQRNIIDSELRLKEAEELVLKYKTVAVKAKREIADLKKKISDLSSELQITTNDRNSCQTNLESVTVQMATAVKDRMAAENSTKSLQAQLNLEKEKLKNTTLKLDQAVKEANKSNLISLEIADYEKLVDELNKQIEAKDAEKGKLLSELDVQKQATKALETQIEQLELQMRQSEERAEQLKAFSSKLKEEIAALRAEEREWKSKEALITAHRESISQEIESFKIQISELVNDNNNLRESNRLLQDANQKVLRSSENRLAVLGKELQEVKEEYANCQLEYENYKVRVHSVLKQQKKSAADESCKSEDILEEKGRLGKITEMLQTRLQELTAQLSATKSELDLLQEEHQSVLQRHNALLLNVSQQESSWKQRFEVLQREMQSQQQELNHLKQTEKLQQLTWSLNLKKQIELIEKEHAEKLEEMQMRLDLAQDEISRLQRDMIESRSSANSMAKEEETILDVVNTERQEGEGSESTDIVFGTPFKGGAVNLAHANSNFIPLEQLLNQDDQASTQSINSVEVEKLENQVVLGLKKIEHLTEILNESEATNARMTEQTRVLKEEIRRLERNQEREQHLANLEYTKNIIVKFLSLPKGDERERLVPVLTTLLRLSPEEERQVHNVALGVLEVSSPVNANSWSSYLPKWPGTL